MRANPLACLWALVACQPAGEVVSSAFATSITTAPGTSSSGSTADMSSSSSSSSTTGAGTDDSAGTTGATLGALDVGTRTDLADPPPVGCDGKIDFLFVISRDGVMKQAQTQLVTAFPEFIETIETKFADFDHHIMVVDADAHWGDSTCSEQCPGVMGLCSAYPCDHFPSACDTTLGAGAVFNAGLDAPNVSCSLAGGRRYIEKGQPDLSETFACVARVGTEGDNWLGAAAAAAVSPALTGPGGCNQGFLRKDALLMVTIIGPYDAPADSPGTAAGWAQTILDAKHGDENAVVMFNIGALTCPPEDRICSLLQFFPYHYTAGLFINDYGPGFDIATDLAETACEAFIPG